MYSVFFLGLASLALSLFLTPLVRNQALRLGVVDHPDGHRKIHTVPIPHLGGIAVLAAAVGAYVLLLLFRLGAGVVIWSGVPFAVRLLPAVFVIFCVGLADDIFGLRPWHKLAGQIVAAMLAWAGGIRIGDIAGHPFSVTLSFVVTLTWIVACSNAVNLIDGVDGLAAGIGLFATITTLIAALLHHNINLLYAAVPLAGALLGFLRFNFSPASIFLGDCGSLTLGLLLGCFGIAWSEKSTTLLSLSAPLLMLSVPLLDAGLSIARRFLRQQPIFQADRAHIHHKLLARGLTPRRVVFVLYGFCLLAAASSLILIGARAQYHGFVIVFVCLAAWFGLQHLGYHEFGVARRLVFGGAFRRLLNAQLSLIKFEQELSASTTLERSCEVLCREYLQFGFSGIQLRLDDLVRQQGFTAGWHVRIDFPGRGYINLTRGSGSTWGSAAMLFVDCVSRAFASKLNELEAIQFEPALYAEGD